jgi:hypothetical protein
MEYVVCGPLEAGDLLRNYSDDVFRRGDRVCARVGGLAAQFLVEVYGLKAE